ncbi:hypothetical protein N5C05_22085, partial [Pseudomonas alcaligenes]|nr:hypothetical protein [Pseudomonas alcaligenes]
DGKPFAIIDAKASVSGKKPKYMSKPGNTRKPGISSLLEGSGSGHNRVVQMSHEWIEKNIKRSVPKRVADTIVELLANGEFNYSRHILYTPAYSNSLLTHLGATFENGSPDLHDEHSALHYSDSDVKKFVNRAKDRERKTGKYAGATGLNREA